MSQPKGTISKILAASDVVSRSLRPQSGEGSSPEFRMTQSLTTGTSPHWSLSQLMQSPSKVNSAQESAESSNKDNAAADTAELFCIPDCKHKRLEVGKMLRCGVCMDWFHFDCVGENPKYKTTWSCIFCRNMPKLIQKLATEFEQLKIQQIEKHETHTDLVSQIDALTIENHKLKSTNSELLKDIDKLTAVRISLEQDKELLKAELTKSADKPRNVTQSNDKVLLIGSSIIRNVEAQNTDKITVICKRGAKQQDIIQDLKKQTTHYCKAVLVVGTNDCDDATKNCASIMEERHQLLTEAKKHANKVIISSILPRVDGALQLKIDTVNKATRDMCLKDPSIDYVCNDGCFKLANQTQNRSLFVSNGLHPSYSGTTNLLRNLGLLDVTVVKRWNPRNNQVQPNEMYMIPPQPHFPGYPPPPQSNAWINRGPQRMGTSYQGNGARPAVIQSMPCCVWCRSSSHFASNCPTRGNRSCYRCGSTAHNARSCSI